MVKVDRRQDALASQQHGQSCMPVAIVSAENARDGLVLQHRIPCISDCQAGTKPVRKLIQPTRPAQPFKLGSLFQPLTKNSPAPQKILVFSPTPFPGSIGGEMSYTCVFRGLEVKSTPPRCNEEKAQLRQQRSILGCPARHISIGSRNEHHWRRG